MNRIIGALMLIAAAVVGPAPAVAFTTAEVMGSIYGTIMGHAYRCGYKLPDSLALKMGYKLQALATSSTDADRAVALVRIVSEQVQVTPTMTCEEARRVFRQAEKELR